VVIKETKEDLEITKETKDSMVIKEAKVALEEECNNNNLKTFNHNKTTNLIFYQCKMNN